MAKKFNPIPEPIQGNRAYSEVRQGVGDDVKNDVLYLHDDETQGGFVDDESNADENNVGVPRTPTDRRKISPSS